MLNRLGAMTTADVFVWGILLGGLLGWLLLRQYRSQRIRKMLKKARAAEKKAISVLEKAGYHVLAVQLRETVTVEIDGKPHDSLVRADMLVRRGWRRYIVDVKTGSQVSPTLPNVRRQLMEYYLVYQPHGMILLDMEKEKIKKVKFTCAVTKRQIMLKNGLFMALGIVLGYAALRMLG